MKIRFLIALAGVLSIAVFAQENLVKQNRWSIRGNPALVKIEAGTGIIHCENDGKAKMIGAMQVIKVNQKKPALIVFSGESKAENVQGKAVGNYCVWMDVVHDDNSRTFGQMANFKTGTHDWEKSEKLYLPKKAVKSVSFYVLFRSMNGKASFRNIIMREDKD